MFFWVVATAEWSVAFYIALLGDGAIGQPLNPRMVVN